MPFFLLTQRVRCSTPANTVTKPPYYNGTIIRLLRRLEQNNRVRMNENYQTLYDFGNTRAFLDASTVSGKISEHVLFLEHIIKVLNILNVIVSAATQNVINWMYYYRFSLGFTVQLLSVCRPVSLYIVAIAMQPSHHVHA